MRLDAWEDGERRRDQKGGKVAHFLDVGPRSRDSEGLLPQPQENVTHVHPQYPQCAQPRKRQSCKGGEGKGLPEEAY